MEARMLDAEGLRAAVRAGEHTGPTAGLAPGFTQANLVVLPEADAFDFLRFCVQNPKPCPVLDVTDPGSPQPAQTAPGADLRTDLPRYGPVHGGPVHVGPPAAIGIDDLGAPDYGDPVEVRDGELPVFWACGVTPQAVAVASRPELMITHAPGHMFVTDLRDETMATL
jgi:uncharacterized protein YcsI (UPF0317 family)